MRAVETLKGAVGQDGGTGRDSSFQADQRVPDCERERRDHACLQRPQSLVFSTRDWEMDKRLCYGVPRLGERGPAVS
jgi:hypothetical protein